MPNLGGWEWVIIGLIALLLLGGSRLAGVGRSTPEAIRDVEDETAPQRADRRAGNGAPPAPPTTPAPADEPGPDQGGS